MNPDEFDASERAALAALLDDPSPRVAGALRARFLARPIAATTWLRRLAEGADPSLARHARRHLAEAGLDDPAEDFRRHIRSGRPDIETGALLLARALRPGLDAAGCPAQLDRLAARARELFTEPLSPRARCAVLNRVLFHEAGLRGDAANYEDPANSLLPAVLSRRRGLPISLAVVYLLVARRAGFALDPVGAPGHFMVGCFEEAEPFYVDAFSGGRMIGERELRAWLAARGAAPAPGDLGPAAPTEVLRRMCRNLERHCAGAGDADGARLCAGFLAAFAAADGVARR